jgi:hypothetical protein
MAKSIIPIGKGLGNFFNENGEFQFYEWQLGSQVDEWPLEYALVWALAFESQRAHFEHRFDRSEYFRVVRASNNKLADQQLNEIIDGLLEKGALVEIDLKADPLEPFFRKHVMLPSARSFGNTNANPHQYGIGDGDEPVILFSGWSRTIWSTSYRDGSIWKTCEMFADQLSDTSARDVAQEFAGVLPIIVATEYGFLEPAL